MEKYLVLLAALWALASAFVAVTPTKVDDEALSKLRSWLERLSFFQPKNSPGLMSLPGKAATPPKAPYDRGAVEAESADEDGAP